APTATDMARPRAPRTPCRALPGAAATVPIAPPKGWCDMTHPLNPPAQGLYDPGYEHDACGVGFVVDLKGRKSHDLVQKGIQILLNLQHRGACGCEPNTGDGAGILLQLPHKFLQRECDRLGIALPDYGRYGVGMVFLPPH